MIRLPRHRRRQIGEGYHRAGWPFALAALAPLQSDDGILLDDFTDATFSYTPPARPYTKPWVAIFHHPSKVRGLTPWLAGQPVRRIEHLPPRRDPRNPRRLIDTAKLWQQSRPHLLGAITLSRDLAREVSGWLDIPTAAVHYPADFDVPPFDRYALTTAHPRLIVSPAWYCRDPTAIHRLPAPAGWQRLQITPGTPYGRRLARDLHAILGPPDPDVVTMGRLTDPQYDELLTQAVVFQHYLGASGSTLLIECIARATPILTNRLPALEEYLGPDYPLFYRDLDHAGRLLKGSAPIDAHHYLRDLPKGHLTAAAFRRQIIAALSEFTA